MDFMFLKNDVENIFSLLETIYADGGEKSFSLNAKINPIQFENGMSGFHYAQNDAKGTLLVGLILGGTGFSLKRTLNSDGVMLERHDYFNLAGNLTFSSDKETLKSTIVDFYEMDLTSPILNHFYNYLSLEYKKAKEGKSQTQLVHSVETFLRSLPKKGLEIAISKGVQDPAIQNFFHKITEKELDQVLTWEERQFVFSNLKADLNTVVSTKMRAHKLSKSALKLALLRKAL